MKSIVRRIKKLFRFDVIEDIEKSSDDIIKTFSNTAIEVHHTMSKEELRTEVHKYIAEHKKKNKP
jgi:hypothetical protein